MSIYSPPKPGSVRAKLIGVFKRDLNKVVSSPHRTNTRGHPRAQGAPLWLIYGSHETFGSRYTMTKCVRSGIQWSGGTEGNFVDLVEPKP